MGDVAEGGGFFQCVDFVLGGFALDHFQEEFAQLQGLVLLLAHDHAQHDVGGGLRDGAAVADE